VANEPTPQQLYAKYISDWGKVNVTIPIPVPTGPRTAKGEFLDTTQIVVRPTAEREKFEARYYAVVQHYYWNVVRPQEVAQRQEVVRRATSNIKDHTDLVTARVNAIRDIPFSPAPARPSHGGLEFVPVIGSFISLGYSILEEDYIGVANDLTMAALDTLAVAGVLRSVTVAVARVSATRAALANAERELLVAQQNLARTSTETLARRTREVTALRNAAARAALELEVLQTSCFVVGTPFLTPEGEKPVEQFKQGDKILSRAENDPNSPVEVKIVEETFVRVAPIMSLRIRGHEIRTTFEHPFYVQGKGWICAKEVQPGDQFSSHDGQWVTVESVTDLKEVATVYNLRVSDYHTYFVGSREWAFPGQCGTKPASAVGAESPGIL
jgi:hypothetical protein